MGQAAAAMHVAGGTLGAVGAIADAKAQAHAASFNAQVARENAFLARAQGKREARLVKEAGLRSLGSIRATVGASGLTMEGSFEDVMAESARNVKRQEMETIFQSELAARGFEAEAAIQTSQGKMAKKLGMFKAASSFLGGGARGFSSFRRTA